jgi:hypothetical protein
MPITPIETTASALPLERGRMTENGRLLLFGIRRMAVGGLNDAHAAHAYITGFGMGYRRPLILLRALMAEISRVSQNRILVAPSCCLRVTSAEATIVAAVGAQPEEARHIHEMLRRMLGVEHCLGALSSAQALGQAFADLGRPLAG